MHTAKPDKEELKPVVQEGEDDEAAQMPKIKKKKVKSDRKPRFVKQGDYQNWTNSFSRMSVHWDKNNELL